MTRLRDSSEGDSQEQRPKDGCYGRVVALSERMWYLRLDSMATANSVASQVTSATREKQARSEMRKRHDLSRPMQAEMPSTLGRV